MASIVHFHMFSCTPLSLACTLTSRSFLVSQYPFPTPPSPLITRRQSTPNSHPLRQADRIFEFTTTLTEPSPSPSNAVSTHLPPQPQKSTRRVTALTRVRIIPRTTALFLRRIALFASVCHSCFEASLESRA
ncbi:hypothetical protein BDU57DRAFT_508632 [Ampelomyces quisqualis]|uniref:REJ domain-containing protein n=1 Tax=Ampelomyces quisqualis TaxID=50730 RepID=A0A6A5QZW4_AMPQU|nr:hypothetical protein BDU57DRAFT_508632 [Ampelomyces quisqualis]